MYSIETVPFGFHITIGTPVTVDEATAHLAQSRRLLATCEKPFGVLVDIRALRPLDDDVQGVVDHTQRLYREQGLRRSAVVCSSAIMTMQFTRIARETGVKAHERYLDASSEADWHAIALAWIVDGVDPEAASRSA